MKKLDLYKQPQKFLNKLQKTDKNLALRILEEIDKLRANPLPSSCKKLAGYHDLYRARIDKYRIIYCFDESLLNVLHIAKREDVYDFLKN